MSLLEIEAGGLRMRRLTHDDAQIVYDTVWRNCNHLMEWMPGILKEYPNVHNASVRIHHTRHKQIMLGIWHEGAFAGELDFAYEDIFAPAYQVGYWLGKEHCGKGIMTRALRRACAFAEIRKKVQFFAAQAHQANIASQRVLLKAGFEFGHRAKKDLHYIREARRAA